MLSRKLQLLLSLPRQLWASAVDRPLPPPTPREQALIDEFRAAVAAMDRSNAQPQPTPDAGWREFQVTLRDHVVNSDPREFTRWPVVRNTMFIYSGLSVAPELKALQSLPDWKARWIPAIHESRYGRPRPYFLYTRSSANLIHHAYHLLQIEQKTPFRIEQFNHVFEYGGGYGSMCRLIHRLQFSGRYTIFDLPTFTHLERFYLKLLDLPLLDENAAANAKGIRLVTDPAIVQQEQFTRTSLFIATWSLSETPYEMRAPFIDFIENFDCFLIAYNERYVGRDDKEYFHKCAEKWRPRFNISDYPIQHTPGNRYLVGHRR